MKVKLKKYYNCVILILSTFFLIKTAPLALHKFLFYCNIKNSIGLNTSNCEEFSLAIFSSDFYYAIFILCFVNLLNSSIILLRKRTWSLKPLHKPLHIILGLIFSSIVTINFLLFWNFFFSMQEFNLFSKHIIYILCFLLALLMYASILLFYLLIWFDNSLTIKIKLTILTITALLSLHCCVSMLVPINIYGLLTDNPENFYPAFNGMLKNLGFGIICMENTENPWDLLLKQMKDACELARRSRTFPRIPNGAGTTSVRWIVRIMNAVTAYVKYETDSSCNEARHMYYDCVKHTKTKK